MPDFSDLEQLRKYLESVIRDVLEKEVYQEVSKQIQTSVVENVYDIYEPQVYERTGQMASSSSIHKYILNGKILIVYHERKDGSRNVSEVVSSGKGYEWLATGELFPRPFMKYAKFRIKNGNLHALAMIKGLRRHGISARLA